MMKTLALSELLSVRHSAFILGAAGSAKTEVWKALARAQSTLKLGGGRTLFAAVNPKAVTSNELYGYVHPNTKELHDGIIAKVMREFSKTTNEVRATKQRIWDLQRAFLKQQGIWDL